MANRIKKARAAYESKDIEATKKAHSAKAISSEEHHKSGGTYVGDFVYGAIDGSVTTFAVVSGVAGASLSANIVIILGLANLFADGFSMAASNFLSTKTKIGVLAKKGHYHHEIKPVKTAFVTFVSFFAVGLIPLLSYVAGVFSSAIQEKQFVIAAVLTGIAFLIVGGIKAKVVKENWTRAALETLLLGGAAAIIAFYVGLLIKTLIG